MEGGSCPHFLGTRSTPSVVKHCQHHCKTPNRAFRERVVQAQCQPYCTICTRAGSPLLRKGNMDALLSRNGVTKSKPLNTPSMTRQFHRSQASNRRGMHIERPVCLAWSW